MDGGCVEERILADEQARLREFERFGQVIDAPNLNLIIYLSPASLVIVCASVVLRFSSNRVGGWRE